MSDHKPHSNKPAEQLPEGSEHHHPSALENALAPGLFEILLERHAKKLILGLILLCLLMAGWTVAKTLKANRETIAGHDLSEARSPDGLLKVAADDEGSAAAGSALILLADDQGRQGDNAAAISTLTRFLDTYKSHPLRPNALFGLAARREASGDLDTASLDFQKLQDEFPNHVLSGLARVRQGDINMEKKDKDAALKVWGQMESGFDNQTDVVFLPVVKQRMDFVKADLPTTEIAPPPPPAPAPPLPSSPSIPFPQLPPSGPDSLLPTTGAPMPVVPMPVVPMPVVPTPAAPKAADATKPGSPQ